MDENKPLLAVPVLRSRVAPVFNWCSRIRIFSPVGPGPIHFREEMDLGHLTPFSRMEELKERGVRVLICGALSPELLTYGEQIGLTIVAGVAGEVEEVVAAFGSRNLDQPKFRLPGCRGPRRCRNRSAAGGVSRRDEGSGDGMPPADASSGAQRGRAGKTAEAGSRGGGPGGACVCPVCGSTVPHRRGVPCTQILCPSCRQPMIRR